MLHYLKTKTALLYSQINKEPATCTFKDLVTPICGISTQVSANGNTFAGIPSFSLLKFVNINLRLFSHIYQMYFTQV